LIIIESSVFWLAAFLLLIIPPEWLISVIFAALIHELCHIVSLLAFRGKIYEIKIGLLGAYIHTDIYQYKQELFCALAGPTGSLLLLVTCRYFPKLAVCGLFHGLFNLIPIYPLDGGRIMKCLLCICFPKTGESLFSYFEKAFKFIVIITFFLIIIQSFSEYIPVMIGALILMRGIYQKKPLQTESNQCTIVLPFFKR